MALCCFVWQARLVPGVPELCPVVFVCSRSCSIIFGSAVHYRNGPSLTIRWPCMSRDHLVTPTSASVSYTHLRAHETSAHL
eukprot:1204396-Alexandrium_andersonii.AAC.1